ncbi:unnamed protein product, partial [Meganyctiphanes norvegica]
YTCLEAIAKRRPTMLDGEWEKVTWIIIKYSLRFKFFLEDLFLMKTIDVLTLSWIVEFCSPALCPNPCMRLELFRLMGYFEHFIGLYNCTGKYQHLYRAIHGHYEREQICVSLSSTLCELNDNYSHLRVHQLPSCNALDFAYVIQHIFGMGFWKDFKELQKTRLILAIAKLTKMFAFLEEDRYLIYKDQIFPTRHMRDSSWPDRNFVNQLENACLNFCGIMPVNTDDLEW